jgi:lactate dehydrogenase-like 2-hydroxyacid dehydrogenase
MAGEFEIIRYWQAESGDALLRREGAGVRAILSLGTERIDEAILSLLPDLELIAVIGAGYDRIDLAAVRARGVIVTNGGALPADDTADYAVGMMIAARRGIIEGNTWVRAGRWRTQGRMALTGSLRGERVGIVGLGNIGRAIGTRVAAFGMDIAWWGPRPHPSPYHRFDSLVELAQWSRVLFVAVRPDVDNNAMINTEVIDALGPDGLLINISRGVVVDEAALIDALRTGRLGQAALDVFESEPTLPESWVDVPNTLLSPHAAGGTRESRDTLGRAAIENIRRIYAGKTPANIVIEKNLSARTGMSGRAQ